MRAVTRTKFDRYSFIKGRRPAASKRRTLMRKPSPSETLATAIAAAQAKAEERVRAKLTKQAPDYGSTAANAARNAAAISLAEKSTKASPAGAAEVILTYERTHTQTVRYKLQGAADTAPFDTVYLRKECLPDATKPPKKIKLTVEFL